MVRVVLEDAQIQADLEKYKTQEPNPEDETEVAYVALLSKVRGLFSDMEADGGHFLAKQLAGLEECHMDTDNMVSQCSQSWNNLAKQLKRSLYFVNNGKAVIYNEGALLEQEKHAVMSAILPIAGYIHQTNVHVDNQLGTQLTVSYSNECKDAESAISSLIQIALESQRVESEQSLTPCLVQVEVAAEGNDRAPILLSPEEFPNLTKLTKQSNFDASDHLIEFKKAVLTGEQQVGLAKTAGKITLTECGFADDGQALSELMEMGSDDMVLFELNLCGNLPFGPDQALKLVKSCSKTIVIGSGAAADLFNQESLLACLKEKAANNGLYYEMKFEYGSFSSSEKEDFRNFLAAAYALKLGLSQNHAKFAETKAEIIQQLSTAYNQDDPDGETCKFQPNPNEQK